jgi:hypothetical protein
MGYRSQVACCISVDTERKVDEQGSHYFDYDRDKFKQMIGFIKLSKFYELWTANESDKDAIGWGNGRFIMYGDGWKWYPDYEDVKEFHKMFEAMESIEGISGYFLRVGEESGDVDDRQFGDDPCYDYFHHFTAMDFTGEAYLGKRDTDEEGQTAQDEGATS